MMTGELVNLRPLEMYDLARLARWRNQPDAFRWFASPKFISESEQDAWFEKCQRDATQMQFAIEDKSGDAVGMIALINIDYHHQSAEVARVLIGDSDMRGRGFGSEALRLLVDYAFNELNLQRLSVVVFADNDRGVALYQSGGFAVEGTLRRAVWKAGAFHDLLLMARLR